jgi:Leucine-rich repeat (LRR) protein
MNTVKKLLGITLCMCIVLVGCNKDDEAVKIPAAEIPDLLFRDYLLKYFDADLDGFISTDEAMKVKEITLTGNQEISSLKGIEYLTSLERLSIRNLDKLKTLDLSHNPELRFLDCSNINGYTAGGLDLNITQNAKLKELYCANIRCTTLPMNNKTELETLACGNNLLETLDLSRCTALKMLDCSNNHLQTIDLSNNKGLKYVNLSANRLQEMSFDLSGFRELEVFYCENTLGDEAIRDLAARNVPLKRLSCTFTGSLTLEALPELESLRLTGYSEAKNHTVDLSKCTKLKFLQGEYLRCRVDLRNCRALEELIWRPTGGETFTMDLSGNKALKSLQFFARTGSIPSFESNTALRNVRIEVKDGERYDFSANTLLESLRLDGWRREGGEYYGVSFDLSNCRRLTELYISMCDIRALDVEKNVRLNTVTVHDCNNLSVIRAAGLQHLEWFELDGTPVDPIEADFSRCVNLQKLRLGYNNHIKSLILTGCTSLPGWSGYPR